MPTPPVLVRRPDALSAQPFDVLVIGGGIYGLTVACDAAQRGLRVALVERNDFGSGTSFNHLRTIHGGLRYLQTLDLPRARESVRERRTLARLAPWAVRPLPFVLPLPRSLSKGPLAMRAGFLLDRMVARDRDDGVPDTHRLPAGRVVSRADAVRLAPELDTHTFTAAAVWYDYVTVDADRLTLSWAQAAAQAGATLANYVDVESLIVESGRVHSALALDRENGAALRIEARTVVNATGGAVNRLLQPFDIDLRLPLLQAVNFVTRRPAPATAVGGRSSSGRNLFLVPWQGRALFGTWESPRVCAPDQLDVQDADIERFLAELNEAFPGFALTRADISLVHRGAVPARLRADGTPTLDGRELIFEHGAQGLSRLISVAGTKYMTARAVAERIVDRLQKMLEQPVTPSRSADTPLPHVDATGDALLRHAAQHEMVHHLSDAVVRRTTIGAVGEPDADTLSHAADIVGDALAWSAERRLDEIASLRRMY